MSHLKQTRVGWENEHLAKFLLSRISFLSNPITVADDLGVDLMCTLFFPKIVGKSEQLFPRHSFAIQIKTSHKPFRGDKQQTYLRELEVPFFVGLIDKSRTGLDIYSGEILPDFFSWAPEQVSFSLRPQKGKIAHQPGGSWSPSRRGVFDLPLPFVGTLKMGDPADKFDAVRLGLADVCTTTIKNIAAKISASYIFQYPGPSKDTVFYRIQAGTGSIHTFRGNFVHRLTEAFYNLRRILEAHPEASVDGEFRYFESVFQGLPNNYPQWQLANEIYGDLKREIDRRALSNQAVDQ